MTEPETSRPATDIRPDLTLGFRCLHLVALCSLAIAQPLLDVIGSHPEFLAIRRIGLPDMAFLMAFLLLGVAVPLLVAELLLAWAPRAVQQIVHTILVWLLLAVFAVQVVQRLGLAAVTTILLAAAVAAALTVLYHRVRLVRALVSAWTITLVIVPVTFLLREAVWTTLTARAPGATELPAIDCRSPLLFIVFDELPTSLLIDDSGRINRHRFPYLAALAETATWFVNATSVAEVTELALPAILTGNMPEAGVVATQGEHPHNLFTLFGRDYDLWVQEPISRLCPDELNNLQRSEPPWTEQMWLLLSDLTIVYLHMLLPPPLSDGLPAIDQTWSDFAAGASGTADDQASAGGQDAHWFFRTAIKQLKADRRRDLRTLQEKLGSRSSRQLSFLHTLLPHLPYELVPPDHRYDTGGPIPGLRGSNWGDDQLLASQAYQRFIRQMQYVDAAVGRIVDTLRQAGLFDDFLIVLVADHGVSFRAGDTRRLVSPTNFEDILPVPLLIKAPNQRLGRVVETPVRTTDILPSVLDLLGVEPPWPMDGTSVFSDRYQPPSQLPFVTKERGTMTFDPALLRDRLQTAVGWKLQMFGDGSDPLDLYRLGSFGDLVGRPLADLEQDEPAAARVILDDPDRLEQYDPDADLQPAFLRGEVLLPEGDRPACLDLAVAINDTVVATTRSRTCDGRRRRFSCLLPTEMLQPGRNRIDVLRVNSNPAAAAAGVAGRQVTLHRLQRDEPIGGLRLPEMLGPRSLHLWALPAAARVQGEHGTTWLTDVVLHNPGERPAAVRLRLLPQSASGLASPPDASLTVAPGTSAVVTDVARTLFALDEANGAIVIGSDEPLLVSSRTYNRTAGGTYSQHVPAVPVDEAITGSDQVRLLPLSAAGGLRCNLGLVNLDGQWLAVNVKLFGNDGSQLSRKRVTLPPYRSIQLQRFLATEAPPGTEHAYAMVSAPQPRALYLAFASLVNGTTGDASFITPAVAGADTLFLPAAVHDSDGEVTWRTAVTAHACTRRAAAFSVTFLPEQNRRGEPPPQSGLLVVKPGKILSGSDVVGTVLGSSGTGGIRIDLELGELMVTGLTYSDRATGQLVPGATLAQALKEGEEGRLLQLSHSTDATTGSRTVIGLCNVGEQTIEVNLALFTAGGKLLGQRTRTVAAGSLLQDDEVLASLAGDGLAGGHVVLRSDTPDAAYFAYASVIDNRTGDPFFVPALPTP